MRLRKKKSLIDQASDYLDSAKPQIQSAVSSAMDYVEDFVESTAKPLLADARDKAGPALADAREKAAPVLADARDKAVAYSLEAREKAAPIVASGVALAGDKAAAGRDLANAKVAQLKGEPAPKKGSKLKKIALFAVIAGVVGVVAKRLQAGKSTDNWQSSYVPAPAPAAPKAPAPAPTPAAPMSGADEVPEDVSGSSPDEALADAAEAPHPITTPDDPAEVIDLDAATSEDEPTK